VISWRRRNPPDAKSVNCACDLRAGSKFRPPPSRRKPLPGTSSALSGNAPLHRIGKGVIGDAARGVLSEVRARTRCLSSATISGVIAAMAGFHRRGRMSKPTRNLRNRKKRRVTSMRARLDPPARPASRHSFFRFSMRDGVGARRAQRREIPSRASRPTPARAEIRHHPCPRHRRPPLPPGDTTRAILGDPPWPDPAQRRSPAPSRRHRMSDPETATPSHRPGDTSPSACPGRVAGISEAGPSEGIDAPAPRAAHVAARSSSVKAPLPQTHIDPGKARPRPPASREKIFAGQACSRPPIIRS